MKEKNFKEVHKCISENIKNISCYFQGDNTSSEQLNEELS